MGLVHLVYNYEAASKTFCLFEPCAPPDFCGGEDTDLPNATSTAGTLLCMTLLMANWVASFFFFGCQMGAVGNEITSDTVV